MPRPLDTSIDRTLPFSTDAALRRRFVVVNADIPANLRLGRLLEQLDDLAEEVALRYVRLTVPAARVVTAAIDDIVLHIPADITQDLHPHARTNYVGRSSMEVGIRVDQASPGSPSLEYVDATERFRRDMAIERRRAFELAHLHAEELAPDRPMVARVDRINFLQPVRIGDKLHFTSRIVYTGETSLCVEITIERISRDRVTKAVSNTCAFTFVNVDGELRPRPVPKVYPATYGEDARYLAAHPRRVRHEQADSTALTTV